MLCAEQESHDVWRDLRPRLCEKSARHWWPEVSQAVSAATASGQDTQQGPGRLVACRALQSEDGLGTRLHLHDDGFLGDFSRLLSDYKENSQNSKGYREASAWG